MGFSLKKWAKKAAKVVEPLAKPIRKTVQQATKGTPLEKLGVSLTKLDINNPAKSAFAAATEAVKVYATGGLAAGVDALAKKDVGELLTTNLKDAATTAAQAQLNNLVAPPKPKAQASIKAKSATKAVGRVLGGGGAVKNEVAVVTPRNPRPEDTIAKPMPPWLLPAAIGVAAVAVLRK